MTERGSKSERRQHRGGIVLGCCFLLGCLLGILFSTDLSSETAGEISEYLSDYFHLMECGKLSKSPLRTLWSHGKWVALCAAAGFSVPGILLLPVLICFRGFLLSFAISCFVCLFGRAGVVPSVIFFGIPAFLWMPALYVTACAAFECSARRIAMKQENLQPTAVLGRKFYTSVLLSILMLIMCVCVECRLVPMLLPAVAEMIR